MASAAAVPDGGTPDGIRYEVAEEILALLRTSSGRELRAARESGSAKAADLGRLEGIHALYTQLRASLYGQDMGQVDEIIREYGPLARLAAEAPPP